MFKIGFNWQTFVAGLVTALAGAAIQYVTDFFSKPVNIFSSIFGG